MAPLSGSTSGVCSTKSTTCGSPWAWCAAAARRKLRRSPCATTAKILDGKLRLQHVGFAAEGNQLSTNVGLRGPLGLHGRRGSTATADREGIALHCHIEASVWVLSQHRDSSRYVLSHLLFPLAFTKSHSAKPPRRGGQETER